LNEIAVRKQGNLLRALCVFREHFVQSGGITFTRKIKHISGTLARMTESELLPISVLARYR